MQFDPNNNIIKLCAEGMGLEGEGKKEAALQLFEQAWAEASNDFEKFIRWYKSGDLYQRNTSGDLHQCNTPVTSVISLCKNESQ